MWRLLMQAGFGMATLNVGVRIARLKRMATYLAVAGVFALFGVAGLLVALGIVLSPHLGPAGAAGAIGGVLVLIAAIVGWVATWTPRKKPVATPIASRVSAELRAAGSALSSATERRPGVPGVGFIGAGRARGLNILLIAALAGVVLGRRL